MRRGHLWLLCAAIALTGYTGCASPPTDDEVRASVRHSAGHPEQARVVALNAETQAAAWVLVAEAHSSGPIVQSKRLSLAFAEGAHERVHYLVGGPWAGLNDRVVIDAFAVCKEPLLRGLRVTLVSPEAPSEELMEMARTYQATLDHRFYFDTAAGR